MSSGGDDGDNIRAERDAAAAGVVVALSKRTTAKSMWTPEQVVFLSMCVDVLPPGSTLTIFFQH